MARKQKFDYFQAFVQISECAVEYASELVKYFEKNLDIAGEGRDPNIDYAIQRFEELHKIETNSDDIKHSIITNLATEFIAPLEREDIMTMASELDDLVDDLDEVLQRMYMYDVHMVPPPVLEMMQIAQKECVVINELCVDFANFKKNPDLRKQVVKLNDLEEEADRLYTDSMHNLFARMKSRPAPDTDPDDLPVDDVIGRSILINGTAYAFGVSKLLDEIEKICDLCEDVGDTVITIVMKNT